MSPVNRRIAVLENALPKLLRRKNVQGVRKLLATAHAADIAALFRKLTNKQRSTVFDLIEGVEDQADILCEIDSDIAEEFIQLVDDERLITLLKEMSGDDAADVLDYLDEERRDKILSVLHQEGEEDVAELYHYDSETAAGIMTPDVFALPADTPVSAAIKTLQTDHADFELSYYLYVTSEAGDLVGVLSLRQLVLSPPETAVHDLMETDVVRVDMTTDQEEVARLVARYNLLAIPVVDETNKLVGAITVDDIIDVIRMEATEDILKMAGVGEGLDGQPSALRSARARLPWLLASFLGGVVAAVLIGFFEGAIEKVVPLAAFIPIVLGMGGNIGIQSATIVTRGLALGRIDTSQIRRVLARELAVSLIAGLTYGVILGLVAWGRYSGTDVVSNAAMLGGSVGLSVAAAMIIAATIGATIPILFERLNVDPALASGPFVTTAVDVAGIAVYFGIAVALLGI